MNETTTQAGIDYGRPLFQAFSVKTTKSRARQKLDRALSDVLGTGWHAVSYGGRSNQFEVLPDDGVPTAQDAWALTYQLRAHIGIASAEPLFKAWVTDRPDWGVDVPTGAQPSVAAFGLPNWSCGSGKNFDKAKAHEWSLELTNVRQAWAAHFTNEAHGPGQDVIIGHPDTGYRRHPEIVANLLLSKGFDVFRNDDDPLDELKKTFPWQNPGHGTGTASVIVSPSGAADGSPQNAVTGTAPYAKLVPFRVSDSVVVLDTLNLARAIERATDQGVHVISISMGGLGSDRLHDAVLYATSRGVIVLAAAGNCVRFVVFPAAYDEVVAVAACDAERGPWSGSSRGRAVDITAPGDRVWHASANADDSLDTVSQGSGTSYAVATVAGIAALWLAKHGRPTIIQACGGKERIASTFSQLLRATATPVPEWPGGQFGGGLVNADALLSAPLPNGTTVPTPAPTATEHVTIGRGGLTTFGHLFEGAVRTEQTRRPRRATAAHPGQPNVLDETLAHLLNTTANKAPADLGQVGQELAFHLATDPHLYRQLEAIISTPDSEATATPAKPASVATNVASIRDRLLAKGVSEALRSKLSAPSR